MNTGTGSSSNWAEKRKGMVVTLAVVLVASVAYAFLLAPDSRIEHTVRKVQFAGYGFITEPTYLVDSVNISYHHGADVAIVLQWNDWATTTASLQIVEAGTPGFSVISVSPPLPLNFYTGIPVKLTVYLHTPPSEYAGDLTIVLIFNINY